MNTRHRAQGLIGLALVVGIGTSCLEAAEQWTVQAPAGRLAMTVRLLDGQLCYTVTHATLAGEEEEVIGSSPLGIRRADQSFVGGLRFVSADGELAIDETYHMPSGKSRERHVRANQRTLTFANAAGGHLNVAVRAADDGVAFRYVFPETDGTVRTVLEEVTGCRPAAGSRAWMSAYQEPSQYTPAYEEYYTDSIPAGTAAEKPFGWTLPALFKTPGGRWVLLAEAANDGSYCAARLASTPSDGLYRFRFPDPADGAGQGAVQPSWSLPWHMPWRVLIVSDALSTVVESTLVDDVNPSSRVDDMSWIKPGRVAWSWWSDHDSPRDYAKQCRFIDLAAEMGWEYYLVDANWTLMDGGTVRDLIDYARQRGVGVLLWYNSGGEHNTVTEKPRGTMKARNVRQFEFDLLRRWGVKGVKIDFFQSDKQNIMQQYAGILEDAAKHRMLINFHGCTMPRGWARTWPHLISMEAVKGEECYSFDKRYPAEAPRLNTIVPFTRNVVGPADLTPCAFSDSRYPHRTTFGHELALVIVVECGLVHFADSVESYRQLPTEPRQFLSRVPVAWDQTRLVAGEPGKFVVMARRHGSAWYVGAIHSGDQPRDLDVSCAFLGLESGRYQARVIGDGDDPHSFRTTTRTVTAADSIPLRMLPYGGAAIELEPLAK